MIVVHIHKTNLDLVVQQHDHPDSHQNIQDAYYV